MFFLPSRPLLLFFPSLLRIFFAYFGGGFPLTSSASAKKIAEPAAHLFLERLFSAIPQKKTEGKTISAQFCRHLGIRSERKKVSVKENLILLLPLLLLP